MFSGIVEEIGMVLQVDHHLDKSTLVIQGPWRSHDVRVGDSISVNGVCLTVCQWCNQAFTVEIMPETKNCTTLGRLKSQDLVNLELALQPNSRIGGHFVQGHIDGTTTIEHIQEEGCALKVWFHKPSFHGQCYIPKCFIAIDGISLTVVDVLKHQFSVCLIPHTRRVTIAHHYQIGMKVNVEVDHLTKTIIHYLNVIDRGIHGFH